MNCDRATQEIPLYYYGEMLAEDEERLEQHLAGCAACRDELARYRRTAAALDAAAAEPSAGLLGACRYDLARALRTEPAPAAARPPAWALFREGFAALRMPAPRFRQPLGAVALLALGWFSARLTEPNPPGPVPVPADVVYSSVRSVQPDPSGQVRIALDETRRRIVSGSIEDADIRRLLLAAVREEENPAVRVESVGILKDQPVVPDVREVLVNAALHDPNPAVRLKAVEGLQAIAGQPRVRDALARVLIEDESPGVRIRAIDMLIEHCDESMVGLLQNVVQRESNSYVRLKCERALKEMNASVGTF